MPDRFAITIAASLLALTTGCTQMTKSPLGNSPEVDGVFAGKSKAEAPTPDEDQTRDSNPGRGDPVGMLDSKVVTDWTVTCPTTNCQELEGLIKTPKQWKVAWQRLHGDEPLPKVDFSSKWVYLVITDAADPNGRGLVMTVYEDGSVSPEFFATLIGFTGSEECKCRFYLIDFTAAPSPYFMEEVVDVESFGNPNPDGVH